MRRFALLVAALVALAGCSTGGPVTTDPGGRTTTPAATPTATQTTTAVTTTEEYEGLGEDGYYRKYEFRVRSVAPADVADDLALDASQLDAEARAVVAAAKNGSANRTVLGSHTPFDDGDYVRANGTYYRVEKAVVESRTVTAHSVDMDGPIPERREDEYATAEAEAVPVSDLSAPDRRVFLAGLPADERLDRGGSWSVGFYHHYPNGTPPANATFAADGPQYVAHESGYWKVAVGDSREMTRRTVRYRLMPVADSADAFAEVAVDHLVRNASNVTPPDARDRLVDTIEQGGVTWEGTASTVPAWVDSLRNTIRSLPGDGRAYLRHDGELYRVLVYWVRE